MICPFCKDGVVTPFANTQLNRCGECGLFINRVFPPYADKLKDTCRNQMLKACHDKEKEASRMADANLQLDVLEENIAPSTIYDVGAAGGFFMKAAQDRGWKVYGNEISEKAIAWAKEHYGMIIDYGFLEEISLAECYYDAVVIWNTLEHTYNPQETLTVSRAMLKQDGLIYIRVPNKKTVEALNKFYERLHLYEFTEECLSGHLDSLGFQCVKKWAGRNPRSKIPHCDYLYRKKDILTEERK